MSSGQGFFESDDDYRDRVAREADERTIEESTGSAPSRGFFESDDEYRDRISQEANERRIEDSTGSSPSKGWIESDEDYRDRIAREANERTIEDSTGTTPSRGWFESEGDYDIRVRREANEQIITGSGASPSRGLFESDHDYRSRIAHEARQVRSSGSSKDVRETSSASSSDSDSESDSSGATETHSGAGCCAGGCVAVVAVTFLAVLGIVVIVHIETLPTDNPATPAQNEPQVTKRETPRRDATPIVPEHHSETPFPEMPANSLGSSPVPEAKEYSTFTPLPPPRETRRLPGMVMQGDKLFVVNVASDDPSQLNVRTGPGQDYLPSGWIPWNGVEIEYLGRKVQNGGDLWVYVRWGDQVGWVHSDYLRPTR